MKEKKCKTCEVNKPYSEYYTCNRVNKSRGNYLYCPPECKECVKKRSTKWCKENPESRAETYRKDNARPHRIIERRLQSAKYSESGRQKEWQRNNRDKLQQYRLNRGNKHHNITEMEWEACINYFNSSCAYCEMSLDEHLLVHKQTLHKEHVVHDGEDDLSNCVPSCKTCNSSKWQFSLEEWYASDNPVFSQYRLNRIVNWLTGDYEQYLETE